MSLLSRTHAKPVALQTIMMVVLFVIAAGLLFTPSARAANPSVPEPAKPMELSRYTGLWYEIARSPNRFERNCDGVTARYTLRKDGDIDVLNTCRRGGLNGKVETAKGRAKVVDKKTFAKLKVSFFGPFYANYWVLDRDDNYQWAIVGEPSGRYVWILSRTPRPDNTQALVKRVEAMGYDTSKLEFPKQPPN